MVICGGSNLDDTVDPTTLSSYAPTVAACYRMDLTSNGISAGWQNEDPLPTGRIMGQMVQMPCVDQLCRAADFAVTARSSSSMVRCSVPELVLTVTGAANGVAGCPCAQCRPC